MNSTNTTPGWEPSSEPKTRPSLILVVGPRSSGTRFFTRFLLDSGAYGDGEHMQRLDVVDPWDSGYASEENKEEILREIASERWIVLRRSIPHGCGIPDFSVTLKAFSALGIRLHCSFIMVRDIFACSQSMVECGHEPDFTTARRSAHAAYATAFSGVIPSPIPVMYSMMGSQTYRRSLLRLAALPLNPSNTPFEDCDEKHYQPCTV